MVNHAKKNEEKKDNKGGNGDARGVARAMKKIGFRECYMVQSGFSGFLKQDSIPVKGGAEGYDPAGTTAMGTIRVIADDVEDTIGVLQESPLSVVSFVGGSVGALVGFVLLINSWKIILEYIAVIGLGKTLYDSLFSDVDDWPSNQEQLDQSLNKIAKKTKTGIDGAITFVSQKQQELKSSEE